MLVFYPCLYHRYNQNTASKPLKLPLEIPGYFVLPVKVQGHRENNKKKEKNYDDSHISSIYSQGRCSVDTPVTIDIHYETAQSS